MQNPCRRGQATTPVSTIIARNSSIELHTGFLDGGLPQARLLGERCGKFCGVMLRVSIPSLAMVACTSGAFRPSIMPALSFPMTSAGVCAGASRPIRDTPGRR